MPAQSTLGPSLDRGRERQEARGQRHRPPGTAEGGGPAPVDVDHAAEGEDGDAGHEENAGGVPADAQMGQGPKPGAPEEGMAGHAVDAANRAFGRGVGDQPLAADGGRARRRHAGGGEDEGDGHDQDRDPGEARLWLPDRDEGRVGIGGDEGREGRQHGQAVETAERPFTENLDQSRAQKGARQQEVPADEEQGRGEEGIEVGGHGPSLCQPRKPRSRRWASPASHLAEACARGRP